MTLAIGDKAPDFSLPTHDGKLVSLSDSVGKRAVVVFFYPKDDTPGCTVEACAFRDRYDAFAEAGAEVIGISSDSGASHEKFAGKHKLPMTLLTDADGKVRALYGVKKTFGLLPGRATFVIDRAGRIQHVFVSQLRVKDHSAQALDVVKRLGAGSGAAAAG
jgi:peroxiredoxin Q/BCP